MRIVNVDVENRPWINVGVADCPTCKATCTGHVISKGQMTNDDWQNTKLEYYCSSCRASFPAPGSSALWLAKVFRKP